MTSVTEIKEIQKKTVKVLKTILFLLKYYNKIHIISLKCTFQQSSIMNFMIHTISVYILLDNFQISKCSYNNFSQL